MKNRAKCKLCSSIIESFHNTDYVTCKCGHISVYGGPSLMQCGAENWDNFLRVDDNGSEVVVKIRDVNALFDPKKTTSEIIQDRPTKQELISILDEMIAKIDTLPQHAMTAPISHYDYSALLILLSSIFKVS